MLGCRRRPLVHRALGRLLLACTLGLGALQGASAQETAASARLTGKVIRASSGEPVAGASVEVLELDRTVLTGESGVFDVGALPPGAYTVRASAPDLPALEETIELAAGERRSLELALLAEPVQVAGVTLLVDRFRVVGDPRRLPQIPGAAHVLERDDLEYQDLLFDDAHRVLRQIPGVNVQEEEGFGLRTNVGLRGTGSERSSKITVMEDGVLVAPAPYAAPAAYYFPTVGRMEAVEVRKGSSQIKYGPLTTGGAINLVSSSIPAEFGFHGSLEGGAFETGKLRARAGDSYGNVGWLVETYRMRSDGFKQLDGGGDTGFDLDDDLVKLRVNADRDARIYQELELKLGRTDQVSHETYLGLTDADFREDPIRRYVASQEDVLRADHEQLQVRHFLRPAHRVDLTTVVYQNDFKRNWYKLNDVAGEDLADILEDPEAFAAELAVIRGATSDPGALRVRANNRSYYGRGVQSVLGLRLGAASAGELAAGGSQASDPESAFGWAHELEVGVRYHADQEDRFQHDDRYQMVDGRMVLTERGAPGSQSNRVSDARAWAVFLQDRISFRRWTVTPGLRFEDIQFARSDYATEDPERAGPASVKENVVQVWIPGVGVSFAPSDATSFFGGVHRGFAPPGPGADPTTVAEESVNYELGARLRRGGLEGEIVGFFNAYESILGQATLAVGETGSGELFNGGGAEVRGIELSLAGDPGLGRARRVTLPLRLAYTYTHTEFETSFTSAFEPWGTVEAGDELPYVPEHQLFASAGLAEGAWTVDLTATYVSAMRTVAGRGSIPPGEGTDEVLLVGLSGEHALTPWSRVFVGVQNLFDQEYVAARRPAGARPGLPRTFAAGVRFTH